MHQYRPRVVNFEVLVRVYSLQSLRALIVAESLKVWVNQLGLILLRLLEPLNTVTLDLIGLSIL